MLALEGSLASVLSEVISKVTRLLEDATAAIEGAFKI